MLKSFFQIFLGKNVCEYSLTLDRFVNKCLEEGGVRRVSERQVEVGEAIQIDMNLSGSRYGSIARNTTYSIFLELLGGFKIADSLTFSNYLRNDYQLGEYRNSRVSRMTVWRIYRMLQD